MPPAQSESDDVTFTAMAGSRRGALGLPSLLALAIAAALVASLLTGDQLQVFGYTDPGSQSAKARERLRAGLGYDPLPGMAILVHLPGPVGAPAATSALTRLATQARADPAVGSVETPLHSQLGRFLYSRDGHSALELVHFRSTSQDATDPAIDRLRRSLRVPGLHVRFGGYGVGASQLNQAARSDLVRAELIAFPALALLLVLIFRGLLAAAIPLVIGGVSVAGTFACLRLLSHALHLSIFALNLAVLLGLGLAVDYGLFLLARFREEANVRGGGAGSIDAAVAAARSGAGRAILLSGLAIAGACTSLLVFPEEFIYSMGIAGVVVALLSVCTALVIGPSLLARGGVALLGRAPPPRTRRLWHSWPRWVLSHRLDAALAGSLILLAAAGPALRLRLTFPDLHAVPTGLESRQVDDVIHSQFTPNLEYPMSLALALNHPARGQPPITRLGGLLALAPGVALARPVQVLNPTTAFTQATLSSPPLSSASRRLVSQLRASRNDIEVAGPTAEFIDLRSSIAARAPLAILLAALCTAAALLWLTRSAILALKALALHALSLAAVFGLLVLIFQDDALGLGSLLGYSGPSAIEITTAVVIVASSYGLATDYSILLLARIVEGHRNGLSDDEAVAQGVERTGPVISRAALLLIVALLALASSSVFLVKQLTVGQALGVAIDVTIVRLLLVPAMMGLLGRLNWWPARPEAV